MGQVSAACAALSTRLTPLIAIPIHLMNCPTILVAGVKPGAILARELEIPCFTCRNTTDRDPSILEMCWSRHFHDIPGLEPIEDLVLLRFADGKAVFVVILNLTTFMPVCLDE